MRPRSLLPRSIALFALLVGAAGTHAAGTHAAGTHPAGAMAQAGGPNTPASSLLGTAFTYQGQLKSGGSPFSGSCSMAFRLYDDPTAGARVGSAITTTVAVAAGLFTVPLDFGAEAFNGDARWLAIQVKCGADLAFTPLAPRQPLTAAPNALALPGLYTRPNATSPNVIGGYSGNVVSPSTLGAVIAGGGQAAYLNTVSTNYGAIGGGEGNTVTGGGGSFVGGGLSNLAGGGRAVVGGGEANQATNFYSTVAGGYGNIASGAGASIGGGGWDGLTFGGNHALARASTIAGGLSNVITATYGTIGGGTTNSVTGEAGTVGGGINNHAGYRSAVAGGDYNTASNEGAVGGGGANIASGAGSTVPGGVQNQALGATSFAAGFHAQAAYDGDFVWADANNPTFAATGPDQFLIRAGGGIGINTNAPAATVDVSGTLRVGSNGTAGTAFGVIQSGVITVGASSSPALVYTMTFPSAFSALPSVVATAYNDPVYNSGDLPDTFVVSVRRVTATYVVFNIVRVDSPSFWSQNLRVDWIAWE